MSSLDALRAQVAAMHAAKLARDAATAPAPLAPAPSSSSSSALSSLEALRAQVAAMNVEKTSRNNNASSSVSSATAATAAVKVTPVLPPHSTAPLPAERQRGFVSTWDRLMTTATLYRSTTHSHHLCGSIVYTRRYERWQRTAACAPWWSVAAATAASGS